MILTRKVVSGVVFVSTLTVFYVTLVYVDNAAVYQSLFQDALRHPKPAVSPDVAFAALKKIVYWNDFFGNKVYYFGTGQQPFLSAGCRYNACYATPDRELFPPHDWDAVIWHVRSQDRSLPAARARHTRYVFFLEESPAYQDVDLTPYDGVFNYTMTYRRDSDVFSPYGHFLPLLPPKKQKPSTTNFADGKTKMAAWFVSHCDTASLREKLVENLRKHITVDVYGSCGTFVCPKRAHDLCMEKLDRDYKFYLSFENSLCRDYVTEKFFNAARYNVVPVVYGMAPYENIAPPHSFINVVDFKSTAALADHLRYLDGNDTAYNEYFSWKTKYEVQLDNGQAWCNLCEKLHTDTQEKIYNIHHWYSDNKCIDPNNALLNNLLFKS